MILTQQEYNAVKEKLKQIEEFIRVDISPYLDRTYEIPFGDEKETSGESHLNLYVDKGELCGYSGRLLISFNSKYESSSTGVNVYNCKTFGGRFGYQLIANWHSVKSKLLEIKTKIIERQSVIDSFTI